MRLEVSVSEPAVFQLEVPEDLGDMRFPGALDRRLQDLLDKQDRGDGLTEAERQEAEALVALAEMLSLLRAGARRVAVGQ